MFIRAAAVGIRFKRCSTLSKLCDTIKLREISGIAIDGKPGQNGWNIGNTSLKRVMSIILLATTLIVWKLKKRSAMWFCYGEKSQKNGKSERFCEFILKKLSKRGPKNFSLL